MAALYGEHPETRLRDVVIPGAHDAGTWGIAASSAIAPGEPEAYNLAKGVVARWSRTQTRDAYTQLKDGIRCLDLRVAHAGNDLVIVHGMVSVTLESVLQQVARFCAEQPREIVLLDFQSLPDAAHHAAFDALVTSALGPRLAPNTFTPQSVTFGALWKANRSVIALSRSGALAEEHPHYWSRARTFTHTWANATTVSDLRTSLDRGLANRDPDLLHCAYVTFTPDVGTIALQGVFSSGDLFAFSKPLFKLPGRWIPEWTEAGLSVNVLSVDFYHASSVVAAALMQNHSSLHKAAAVSEDRR
jgi:hypothetical protein